MPVLSYTEKDAERIFLRSSEILKDSGIIAYPTESFYALGVLATDETALRKLYKLKKRPSSKPLPMIVGDREALLSVVRHIPSHAEGLMNKFWPGPLTLVFEANDMVSDMLTGGTGKVAVRIPGQGIALYLAKALKMPVTSTSANISGQPPADTTDMIIGYFSDDIDLIIDGGKTPGGKPSTIIDVTVRPPKVLRAGSISVAPDMLI